MNPPADRERLLDDVLSEAAPADFRTALLGETLRLARGRRRLRKVRRAGAAIVIVSLLGVLVWRSLPPGAGTRRPPVTSCEIVHTQPLPAGAIVRTQPLGADRLVVSVASVGEIRTAPATGILHLINDDELLALAAPIPAALVRVGPHAQELIFLNPAEQNGLPMN